MFVCHWFSWELKFSIHSREQQENVIFALQSLNDDVFYNGRDDANKTVIVMLTSRGHDTEKLEEAVAVFNNNKR